jgi:hypothetical protein
VRRIAAVCLLLTLVACGDKEGGPTPTTPAPTKSSSTGAPSEREQVVETLMRAIEDGDCDTAKKVVVTPSAIDCAQLSEASGMLAAEGVDMDDVRYEDGDVAGDSSTVTITWSNDLPSETIDVQRVDDTWLVVFDSSP